MVSNSLLGILSLLKEGSSSFQTIQLKKFIDPANIEFPARPHLSETLNLEPQTSNLTHPHLQLLSKIINGCFEVSVGFHHIFNGFKCVDNRAMIAATKVFTD